MIITDMISLLVFTCVFGLAVGDFNVLLLHNNDMHARFQQADRYAGMCVNDSATDCYGGFARTHSEVVKLKTEAAAKGRPTIFLNAGDSYQGTPYYTFFKWPIVSQFVSLLELDVMSLGNHEFDDGISGLAPYIANVTVPIVCCNINVTLEPTLQQPNLTPSKVITVNGTKIGIIGYLTPDTVTLSSTGRVKIYDEIPCIQAEAKRLKALGIPILIAVGHSGYTKDQEIAKAVAEIDVVVGGHSHTFLYSGTPPDVEVPKGPYPTVITQDSGKQVPVVQAYYATKYLGYLELNFDDSGNLKSWNGSPILLSGNLPQDPNILSQLKPYEDQISEKINTIVGYAYVLLDNNQMICKLGECNLGNLITDAYVDYAARTWNMLGTGQGWTPAAIGLNQAGGIRASINPQNSMYQNGSITLGDIITTLPWGGKIMLLNLTGEVLLQALEFSMARYDQTVNGHVSEFLQVSGMQVVYNVAQPSGHRVVSVRVLCSECQVPEYQPLNSTKTYGVVMPDYIGRGGDNFTMFENISTYYYLDEVDYNVVSDYMQRHSPVHPTVEGRIIVMNSTIGSSGHSVKSSWAFLTMTLLILMIKLRMF